MLYVILIGGDFMAGRLLLSGGFALACATGVVAVERPQLPLHARAVGLLIIVAIVGLLNARPVGMGNQLLTDWVVDERAFYVRLLGSKHPTSAKSHESSIFATQVRTALTKARPGTLTIPVSFGGSPVSLPLKAELAARRTKFIVTRILGIMATHVGDGVDALDPIGLADPLAAHARLKVRGRPGHEKALPLEWYVAWLADPKVDVPKPLDRRRVVAARHALACGRLAELLRATTGPMTARRWLDNLGSAARLTTFRFDTPPSCRRA